MYYICTYTKKARASERPTPANRHDFFLLVPNGGMKTHICSNPKTQTSTRTVVARVIIYCICSSAVLFHRGKLGITQGLEVIAGVLLLKNQKQKSRDACLKLLWEKEYQYTSTTLLLITRNLSCQAAVLVEHGSPCQTSLLKAHGILCQA